MRVCRYVCGGQGQCQVSSLVTSILLFLRCVCIHLSVCICTCVRARVYMYVSVCMCMLWVCVYKRVCCVSVYMCVHVCRCEGVYGGLFESVYCECVYMCMDVYVCVHGHVCVLILKEARRGHGIPWSQSYSCCKLPGRSSGVLLDYNTVSPALRRISGDRVSLLTWSSFTRLEWLASKPRGFARLCLPCTAITGLHLCTQLVTCTLGSELRTLPTKPSLPCPAYVILVS